MQKSPPTIFPMASAQERLWIVEQLTPGTTAYTIPLAVRLKGRLDRDALLGALRKVTDRHEALRTRFAQLDGKAVQIVDASVDIALPLTDVTEAGLDAALSAEAARPFDLANGPLLRACLLRLAADDHVLVISVHHLVSDMWSCGILLQETGALYAALVAGAPDDPPRPELHYPDFSVWETEHLSSERLESQLAHWREELRDAPHLLDLPLDRARPRCRPCGAASCRSPCPPNCPALWWRWRAPVAVRPSWRCSPRSRWCSRGAPASVTSW